MKRFYMQLIMPAWYDATSFEIVARSRNAALDAVEAALRGAPGVERVTRLCDPDMPDIVGRGYSEEAEQA